MLKGGMAVVGDLVFGLSLAQATVLLLSGAVAGWLGWICFRLRWSRSWPTVEGRIVRSEIRIEDDDSGDPSIRMFAPRVEYSYCVDGREYCGSQVAFWEVSASTKAAVEDPGKRFPIGSTVAVFYNPMWPADSLLDSARPTGWWHLALFLAPAVGVGLCVAGVIK